MKSNTRKTLLMAMLPFLLLDVSGCGGGSRKDAPDAAPSPGCDGSCANASTFLSVADVERILAQGITEAQARGVAATFAVSDRVGNVLAVYRMTGANPAGVEISTRTGTSGGLEGVVLPSAADGLAAIAKAVTGAYLSSEGNAFSTRTAGQIVQDHFNPGENFQPAGPLFGVQFSQLACSDLTTSLADGSFGPKQSPLGLAADPGGFPLYKNGTVVGGVGVIADGDYSVDLNILDRDSDLDELIAYAAAFNYAAPVDRRANRITADGKTLRFSDVDSDDLNTRPDNVPAFGSIGGGVGALVAVSGYNAGAISAGTAFGQPASGIRADGGSFADLDAFILVDGVDAQRFAPAAGTDGADALTANEVSAILRSAIRVANQSRAQIRQPLGSQARVTVSVVDSAGEVLGILRTRDAPVFGTDVSLQKARSAAFFSGANTAALVATLPDTTYLNPDLSAGATVDLDNYVTASRTFLGLPGLLADGNYAFATRSIGNLARPYYPDGIDGNDPGPLGKPAGQASAFSTGLQLDLVYNAIIQHVAFAGGLTGTDVTSGCAGKAALGGADVAVGNALGANGLQIFPGGVPIYRGDILVGAIGVSGDGVDQDDMIAFLGLHEAGLSVGNAQSGRRADQLTPQGTRLRYVQCPQAPFFNSNAQNVCAGK